MAFAIAEMDGKPTIAQAPDAQPGAPKSIAGPVDTGIESLAIILHLLGQPSDAAQLRHRFGAPGGRTDAENLLRAARLPGVKARLVTTSFERLDRTSLPAIAERCDGSFVVLAKVAKSGDKVLILDPAERKNKTIPRDAFEEAWTGRLIVATTRAKLAGAARVFDFTWFVPAVAKYRRLFGEVLVASFFLQLVGLVSPLMFQVVIDKVVVHRSLSTLDVLVVALVAMAIFEALLAGMRSYVFSHTTTRIDAELSARLFGHLLSLPMTYFQSRPAGSSIAHMKEMENVRSFLTGSAMTAIIDLVFTVMFIAVMFLFSALLTWIVLAAIPFYVVVSLVVTPILRRRLSDKFRRGSENQALLVETVSGIETVKSMAVEPQMRRRWEEQIAGYVQSSFSAGNLANQAGQAIKLVNKLTVAATLWFGARLVISGDLSIGELIAFNMLATRVSAPVLRMAQLWQDFQQVRISVDRLGDILNVTGETQSGTGRITVPALKGAIAFERVVFRYRPDEPEILKGVSLAIKPGEVLGVVGPSGSGKSTLAKLIQRLYVPEAGRVQIDGNDLGLLDPTTLRRQIGVVQQDNVLFTGTIRDNIALANPQMDMPAVTRAARLAGAHDFITATREGYDTVVGERGSSLSGGQRQRIAIARALATDPRILIFDEATSALDAESERALQENMRQICQGRTVIIIAHRLSAVRGADRIVTIEAGRIVEDGNHETLLRSGGRYATLYRNQVGVAS